jgi:hypothetical protein
MHEVVLREHFGNETMQSVFPCYFSEPAQQRGAHAAKVLCVRHHYGHFGVSGLLTGNIIGYAQQLARTERAE